MSVHLSRRTTPRPIPLAAHHDLIIRVPFGDEIGMQKYVQFDRNIYTLFSIDRESRQPAVCFFWALMKQAKKNASVVRVGSLMSAYEGTKKSRTYCSLDDPRTTVLF